MSLPGDSLAVFDRLSRTYESPQSVRFYAGLARTMAESAFRSHDLGPGSTCLDLACGTGISTEAAVEVTPGAEWHGVDQSGEMLAEAARKPHLRGVNFTRASADALPFPDRTFDWLLCNVAYHWLPLAAVDEMHRVLAPGGAVSLMVPLISPAGSGTGNRWLAEILLHFARCIASRRSQGLTLPKVRAELRAFAIHRAERVSLRESFASAEELRETLVQRSSFAAIFGPHAEEVGRALADRGASDPGPLDFEWHFAFVEASKPR